MIERRSLAIFMGSILLYSQPVFAQSLDSNVFVTALQRGRAEAPVPNDAMFGRATASLQTRAGDSGPIWIRAVRLHQFKQQSSCGRVAFYIFQPSTHKTWPTVGGQLNICTDGMPPLRVCSERPQSLVSAGTACPNGTPSIDTPEVATAIRSALNSGGLSAGQVEQASNVQAAARAAKSAIDAEGLGPGSSPQRGIAH